MDKQAVELSEITQSQKTKKKSIFFTYHWDWETRKQAPKHVDL